MNKSRATIACLFLLATASWMLNAAGEKFDVKKFSPDRQPL
ncbi:MAG: hypothetical protein ABI833_11390 [Acidobacteriota bacterium]